MQQKTLFPTLSATREEHKKQRLRDVILKKKKRLALLITKTELLKVELEMVRQEYDVRIGKLYLKDNQLDLEIIRYKNIQHLMSEGLSFEEAVQQINNTYYEEQLRMEKESHVFQEEEEIIQKREQAQTYTVEELKKLWKKLITQFHPDLTQDPEEKTRREHLLKAINRAYEEQDLAKLQQCEHDGYIEYATESTLEKLEEILVAVENEIIKQTLFFRELKQSEWFTWKKRLDQAKKRSLDIFKDLEKKLLDDILKKYALLREIKSQIGQSN